VVKQVAVITGMNERMSGKAAKLGLKWPMTKRAVMQAKGNERRSQRAAWAKLANTGQQGKGVEEFFDAPEANTWLYDPCTLAPGEFMLACKMRTNTCQVKASLAAMCPGMPTKCRRCHLEPETLGHVVGGCSFTKKLRIARHNKIVDALAERVAQHADWEVQKEQVVATNDPVYGPLLRPDLIFINRPNGHALVVDVTVPFEGDWRGESCLDLAAQRKRDKYECLRTALLERSDVTSVTVHPFVIGCRGAIHASARETFGALGLKKSCTKKYVSRLALHASMRILGIFLDGVEVRAQEVDLAAMMELPLRGDHAPGS